MKMPKFMLTGLQRFADRLIRSRKKPDQIIMTRHLQQKQQPYLYRWYVIPRNPIFNIYLHLFLQSDDDRALHDHPWMFNASIILQGDYLEHCKGSEKSNILYRSELRREGHAYFRWWKSPHRIELFTRNPRRVGELVRGKELRRVHTLFITGPRIRRWGFYCPKGWVLNTIFNAEPKDKNGVAVSEVGRGCE